MWRAWFEGGLEQALSELALMIADAADAMMDAVVFVRRNKFGESVAHATCAIGSVNYEKTAFCGLFSYTRIGKSWNL